MQKQYYEPMTLQQIINYLKDGVTAETFKARHVNTPTITYMIRSLQSIKEQISKTHKDNQKLKKNSNQKQYTDIISFYNAVLQKINKCEPLQMSQKQHCNLNQLMRFYNQTSALVSKYYSNTYVKGSAKMTFWQILQSCLQSTSKIQQNYQSMKAMVEESRKYIDEAATSKNRINQLNKNINQLNKQIAKLKQQNAINCITQIKIQQINQLYSKLMRGDIEVYQTFKKSTKVYYKMEWVDKIMQPIVRDYQKMQIIQHRLSQCFKQRDRLFSKLLSSFFINEKYNKKQNMSLTEKCMMHIQRIQQNIEKYNQFSNHKRNYMHQQQQQNKIQFIFQLIQQIKTIQTLKYSELKSKFSKQNASKINIERQAWQLIIVQFLQSLGKVIQIPNNKQLLPYIGQLLQIKEQINNNKINDNKMLNSEISDLKKQLLNSQQVIKSLSEQNSKINQQKQRRNTQRGQLQLSKNNQSSNNRAISNQIAQLQSDNKYLNEKLQVFKAQYSKVHEENKKVIANIKQKQCRIAQLQSKIQALKVDNANALFKKGEFQALSERYMLAEQQKKKVAQQNNRLQQTLASKQQTINSMQAQIQRYKQQQEQNKQHRQANDKANGQLSKLKQKYERQSKLILQFVTKCSALLRLEKVPNLQQLPLIQCKIQKLLSYEADINDIFEILRKKLEQANSKNEQPQQQYFSEEQVKQMEGKIKYIQVTINNILNIKVSSNAVCKQMRICDSSLMVSSEQNQALVSESVCKYLQNDSIVRYNLLLRINSSSTNSVSSINEVLSRKANTLLLILTKQQHTIAVYSTLSYCQSVDMRHTKALLVSTHSKAAYAIKKGYKAVECNEQYLVVGNGEIKISKQSMNNNGSMLMETKVNKAKSVFDIGTHTHYDIFGEDVTNIQIRGYEIYEVIFKNHITVQISKQNNKLTNTVLKNQEDASIAKVKQKQKEIKELKYKLQNRQQAITKLRKDNQQLKQNRKYNYLSWPTINYDQGANFTKSLLKLQSNQKIDKEKENMQSQLTQAKQTKIKVQIQILNKKSQLQQLYSKIKQANEKLQTTAKQQVKHKQTIPKSVQQASKLKQIQLKIKQLTIKRNKLDQQCIKLERDLSSKQTNYQYMQKMNIQIQNKINQNNKRNQKIIEDRKSMQQKQIKMLNSKFVQRFMTQINTLSLQLKQKKDEIQKQSKKIIINLKINIKIEQIKIVKINPTDQMIIFRKKYQLCYFFILIQYYFSNLIILANNIILYSIHYFLNLMKYYLFKIYKIL